MMAGMVTRHARWCSFAKIRGLDRTLRNQLIQNGSETPLCSLPLSHRPNGEDWGAEPCNIVVFGAPGTGKSTLAMDMAAKIGTIDTRVTERRDDVDEVASLPPEPCTVLYYALEQSPESLERRFRNLAGRRGVELTAVPMVEVPGRGDRLAEDRVAHYSEKRGPGAAPTNLVLLPRVSPRPLEDTGGAPEHDADRTSIFWRRYAEIRHLIEELQTEEEKWGRKAWDTLLREEKKTVPKQELAEQKAIEAAKEARTEGDCRREAAREKEAGRLGKKTIPPLRMVVIDSLSMFGDKPVTRYLVDQLFALFTEKGLVGLFVVEERGGQTPDMNSVPAVPSDVCFSADVVIRLGWMVGDGYSHRTMEVTKSRHSPNSYGKQWIKVRDSGIEIYPSLHNWYTHLHSGGGKSRGEKRGPLPLVTGGLAGRLNPDFLPQGKSAPPCGIVLVAGPLGTGKVPLAAQYALNACDSGSFLLISFAECPQLGHQATRSGSVYFGGGQRLSSIELASSKGTLTRISVRDGNGKTRWGYQLWLAPGYLLSEELVWFTDECLRKIARGRRAKHISRVILADVGHIPSRYPAVSRQILDGTSNFFPVLRKLFEHHQVDCVFVCSTDDPDHDLTRFLKPLAHHCIETRLLPVTTLGGPGRIEATVSGRWVKGWKKRTFGPDWSS